MKRSIQKLEQYKMSNPNAILYMEIIFSRSFQGDNPGFDVVIGNPPYVNIYKIAENSEEVDYFKKNMKLLTKSSIYTSFS